MAREQEIGSLARDVLQRTIIEGTVLKFSQEDGNLERSLYEEVNEVLTRLGGKWKRGKGHVFDTDPTEDIAVAWQTGMMPPKNPHAFFSTTQAVLDEMMLYFFSSFNTSKYQGSLRFLEPSAGKGAIAKEFRRCLEQQGILERSFIHVCEIQPIFAEYLAKEGFTVIERDFLAYQADLLYDGILMNPPFSVEGDKKAYITHITHAWNMLAPGGVLVAIGPPGFTFEGQPEKIRDRKIRAFRELVDDEGRWDELPPESFKESGTSINMVIITLHKSSAAAISAPEKVIDITTRQRVEEAAETIEQSSDIVPALVLVSAPVEAPKSKPVFGDPHAIAKAFPRRAGAMYEQTGDKRTHPKGY
jgi:hypothetical protein